MNQENTKEENAGKESLPKGIGNAFGFSIFNALSFTNILGAPMLLYFQKIDASAAVLSIVASMVQFLNIFQIPAAKFVEAVGYKKFVLRGWSVRIVFTIFMSAVTLLPSSVNNSTRMCLMLMLLFCFNTSRGISACGFLPWMTRIVPESLRGRYVSTDMLCVTTSTVLSSLGATIYLKFFDQPWQFAPIFLISFIFGVISLYFLKKIPDAPVEHTSQSNEPIPWKQIVTYRPFLKILIFNFICNTTFAASGIFYIPFLRNYHHASDSLILFQSVLGGTMGCISLFSFGKMLDRVGSKPFIFAACVMLILHYAGWGLVAGGILPFNVPVMLLQAFTSAIGGTWFGMSNMRLAMATVPQMGRSHFFAVLTVASSLTLGIVPIIWGVVIDSLVNWKHQMYGWQWNQYSLMYAIIAGTMFIALLYHRRLDDPRAMTTEDFMNELFIKTPSRAISRLWPRRFFKPFM